MVILVLLLVGCSGAFRETKPREGSCKMTCSRCELAEMECSVLGTSGIEEELEVIDYGVAQ
jgi:hypothetical protein